MDNRRSAPRRNTVFHSKVFNAETGDLVGHMVDVSVIGLRIMATEQLEPGLELQLELELPRSLYGHETLVFESLVKWCRPDINPDYWAIGFEISTPSDETAVILGALQGTLCFEH